MPARALLIEVHLLGGRYHGADDWPPSPFRLFQALVSGAYGGRWRSEIGNHESEKDAAFRWLERLPAPHIAAPPKIDARATTYFVPNNDIDTVEGDPGRASDIRVGKRMRPILLTADAPLIYAWPFDSGEDHARRLCSLAERLHTLGRGIDAAFTRAEICAWQEAEARLVDHSGPVSRPGKLGDPRRDPLCPVPGSLDSLKRRYAAGAARFALHREGRTMVTLFNQPEKALARAVTYDRAPARLLFELRQPEDPSVFRPVPQEQACAVAIAIRDLATRRLKMLLPQREAEIDRLVTGRGAGAEDIGRRIRIIPLPSIGHIHTSPSIRRVLVEVPPDCPLPARAVMVALANQSLDRVDAETGEIIDDVVAGHTLLVPAEDDSMLWHYGVGDRAYRRWQSITPAALPVPQPRGRARGSGRMLAERQAATAVAQALRHAGFGRTDVAVRVQREPFRRTGARADAFNPDRFAGRLRHVAVAFSEPVSGPIVIGDGRWLGFGVMAPLRRGPPALHVFAIDQAEAPPLAARETLVRALRNAVMARVDTVIGGERRQRGETLPVFFTGHVEDGAPARSSHHEHLFFLADDVDGDGRIDRLAIVAPHLADRSIAYDPDRRSAIRSHLDVLDRALAGFTLLRAGRAGAPHLLPMAEPGDDDPVFGRAKAWVSRTPYRPTRHAGRRKDVKEAIVGDVLAECDRRALPRPEVEVIRFDSIPNGGGFSASVGLRFEVATCGPLLLGRDSHRGGGLFAAKE